MWPYQWHASFYVHRLTLAFHELWRLTQYVLNKSYVTAHNLAHRKSLRHKALHECATTKWGIIWMSNNVMIKPLQAYKNFIQMTPQYTGGSNIWEFCPSWCQQENFHTDRKHGFTFQCTDAGNKWINPFTFGNFERWLIQTFRTISYDEMLYNSLCTLYIFIRYEQTKTLNYVLLIKHTPWLFRWILKRDYI